MADEKENQVDTVELTDDEDQVVAVVEDSEEGEDQAEEQTAEETEDVEDSDEETEEDQDDEEEDEDGAKWYVINTYSGHENKVAQQIEQRAKALGLDEQIQEVIVPTQERVVAKGGKKKTVKEKFLPGYVIIKMIITDDSWHIVRNTQGVTGFIGPSKKPTPLKKEEVQAIMAYTKVSEPKYQASFKVGDSVRVTEGPFKDFIGGIQEINEGKGQVTVLLSIFGRETPVQLDFIQVTNL